MDLSLIFVILILGGWFFSKLFLKLKLPSIVGMLFCGLLISYFLKNYLSQSYTYLKSYYQYLIQ
ncbi:MAG: hypothetical protein PHY08_11205 [Candidatus Cloacimonetes bacterium]|nr:hypothetical protein [Candidatus Cloacimonadota bacterium]